MPIFTLDAKTQHCPNIVLVHGASAFRPSGIAC